MPRFVAFLRGVMPTNAKMPELKSAFESAPFTNVRTVLRTGNLAFDALIDCEAEVEQRAEEAMLKTLGRSFYTIVRPSAYLEALVATDPYTAAAIPRQAKRVISFMREAQASRLPLPLAEHQASVFLVANREVFTAYMPTPKGPVFMALIERAFGLNLTTRTFETVVKCASA
jgi:uncharacterized protein (DUF1697 family)